MEAHFAWKQRTAEGMPEAAARVFALRGKMYAGCGFHYALERSLGSVIRIVNTLEFQEVSTMVIDEVIVEHFFRDLALAEASALSTPSPHPPMKGKQHHE